MKWAAPLYRAYQNNRHRKHKNDLIALDPTELKPIAGLTGLMQAGELASPGPTMATHYGNASLPKRGKDVTSGLLPPSQHAYRCSGWTPCVTWPLLPMCQGEGGFGLSQGIACRQRTVWSSSFPVTHVPQVSPVQCGLLPAQRVVTAGTQQQWP